MRILLEVFRRYLGLDLLPVQMMKK